MRGHRHILVAVLAPLAAVVFPIAAAAGGVSWSARVLRCETSDYSSFEMTIEFAEGESRLGCESLEVFGSYHAFRWWLFGGGILSKRAHRSALEFLQDAQKQGFLIRFGEMGEGFRVPNDSEPCRVESRGLKVVESHGGGKHVLSFYKWP